MKSQGCGASGRGSWVQVAAIVLLVGLTATLGTAGCGKLAEKAMEKVAEKAIESGGEGNADVDLSKGKMTIKGKDGSGEYQMDMSGEGGVPLPEDFPSDVPIYSDHKIVMANKMPGGGTILYQTSGSINEVYDFCKQGLESQGWDIQMQTQTDKYQSLHAQKNDGARTATIGIGRDEDQGSTTVTTTYAAQS